MEHSEDQLAAHEPCPTCGASIQPGARFCADCGSPLDAAALGDPAAATVPLLPQEAPDEQPVDVVDDEASPAPSVGPDETTIPGETASHSEVESATAAPPQTHRICEWCGAENPLTAETCVACSAVFPQPEQEAVFLREAEERLRAEEEAHEREQRERRSKWWKVL